MSAPPSALVVVLNPRSGGGRSGRVLERVRPLFEQAGVELDVRETRFPGHARELAREASVREAGLCVIGGDGTIHEVVNGLMALEPGLRPPLGVLPGGSGNALLHDLDCLDPDRAARRILTGERRPLDVLRLTDALGERFAFNIVGWGQAADVGRMAESMRWLGPRRYTLASALSVLGGELRPARLAWGHDDGDWTTSSGRFVFVMACNTRHTGTGMLMAPRARIDDGLVDVVIVKAASRLRLLGLLSKVSAGRHLGAAGVQYMQVSRFALASELPGGTSLGSGAAAAAVRAPAGAKRAARRGALNVDGEIAGGAPFEVRVVRHAIELLV